MLSFDRHNPLARALDARRAAGSAGVAMPHTCAAGNGWSMLDVICCAGPGEPRFEERHSHTSVSFVVAGSFDYRSSRGRALLTPGSVLLGNAGAAFDCGHDHGEGDRCLSFHFDPGLLEEIARDAGYRVSTFDCPSLPPLRELSPLFARSCAGVGEDAAMIEGLALEVAAAALRATSVPLRRSGRFHPRQVRRIVETVRYLEIAHTNDISVANLASRAGVTRFHFLRIFKHLVGTTPHQFLLRLRLRDAAGRLVHTDEAISVIAYDVGFRDLSHFTRSFFAEFGCSPSRYRAVASKRAGRSSPRMLPQLIMTTFQSGRARLTRLDAPSASNVTPSVSAPTGR